MMPLDVCTPFDVDEKTAKDAMDRTYEWAVKSKNAWLVQSEKTQVTSGHVQPGQVPGHLFGIIQGNFFPHLRRQSAEQLVELDLPGYAIGGLSVGENPDLFDEICGLTASCIPLDRPRYVMGIGTPEYILSAVAHGIDMFDCVFPTRIARNAMVFTADGTINLRNEKYKLDQSGLDPECRCPSCTGYSRSYLRHLYKTKEILASMLATRHNLWFLETFVENIRKSINQNNFAAFKKAFLKRYMGRQNK
ncbi:MAG: tRNA-guanine transglycosylase [Spirochaetaceae bacterium]|nr:MAG: tRNA-guanine transglycosylase [Spirochaetaceae bacterium]